MTRLMMVLLLAGCATIAPKAPKYVEVEVVRYVEIPRELTEPCEEGTAREQTYAEAKRLALFRLASVRCGNADKAKIRALGQKP